MEVLHRKCAGLEVQADTVVGALRVVIGHKVTREVARFGATARGLIALGDWLARHAVTHVAVATTGERWKPVWYLLAGRFELVLADAAAEVADATGLADALAAGLVRGGVAAPAAIPELQELLAAREQFARDLVQHTRWILDVLESCNLKLAVVTSDILGVGGRAFLDALIGGEEEPEKLAALAQGTLRARRGLLVDALPGRIADHHRFLLGSHLRLVENLEQGIASLEADVDRALVPYHDGALTSDAAAAS
jgi:transposase